MKLEGIHHSKTGDQQDIYMLHRASRSELNHGPPRRDDVELSDWTILISLQKETSVSLIGPCLSHAIPQTFKWMK